MALIFQLDKICVDGDNHVAYVRLVDDTAPDHPIGEACIPYSGNAEAFQAAVEAKFAPTIAAQSAKVSAAAEVGTILSKIDATKIAVGAARKS